MGIEVGGSGKMTSLILSVIISVLNGLLYSRTNAGGSAFTLSKDPTRVNLSQLKPVCGEDHLSLHIREQIVRV